MRGLPAPICHDESCEVPALPSAQRLTPQLVHVPRGRVKRVDFHLYTGVQ
jgi:hypothetical protein